MYVQDRHAYHVTLTSGYRNSDQLVSTLDSLWKLSKQALVEFYTLDNILYNGPQTLEETFADDSNPHVKALLALIGDAYQCQKSLVALMKSQYQEICGMLQMQYPASTVSACFARQLDEMLAARACAETAINAFKEELRAYRESL